jgi:hypothetical protein
MGQNAGRSLERQWRADLSKVLGDREKATASSEDRLFPKLNAGSPHWHPAIQLLI